MRSEQQRNRRGTSPRSARPFRGGLAAVLAACVGAAAPAMGAPLRISARQDPGQESSFTLDLGGWGGVSSARIARTDFELEIDTAGGTAHFIRYNQDIDPLTLPGEISTGAIHVEVVENSSVGTFNRATGEFATSEIYAIYFAGDLSAYGLTSPVLLPSKSAGIAKVASTTLGSVAMDWAGASRLGNPFDPATPIDYSYVCSIVSEFTTDASSFIGLRLIPQVLSLGLSPRLETVLTGDLDSAMDNSAAGKRGLALYYLNGFAQKIDRLRGTVISFADARSLLVDARQAMRLVRNSRSTPSR